MPRTRRTHLLPVVVCVFLAIQGVAAQPCEVPDNGSGTVDLPPAGCGYVAPSDLHLIIDGLPPGTEIRIDPVHQEFFNTTTAPGGNLGGEVETFDSEVELVLTGTGALSGFNRTIVVPLAAETHTGPRTPGSPVQTFSNDMFLLQGAIFGDPDFDVLRIEGGTAFGLPSPGQTTPTRLPSGDFNVDSFFDIAYRIEFQGAPGGVIEGLSGTTTASVDMRAGGEECAPLPARDDAFPSTAKLVLQLADGTHPFVVRLSSADLPDTIVRRHAQVGDTIDTEILSMDLAGFHPRTGPIQVSLNPAIPSTGRITGILQAPGDCHLISADSFFDVMVDIDLPALGETWNTGQPVRLEQRLGELPPQDLAFESPILDSAVLADGVTAAPRGQLLYSRFHVDPFFPPAGEDCFDTFLEMDIDLPLFGYSGSLAAQGPATIGRGPASRAGLCELTGLPCQNHGQCRNGGDAGFCVYFNNQAQLLIQGMSLVGSDPLLGQFLVRTPPTGPTTTPSIGQAISQDPATGGYAADASFDVFFEVELETQGVVLRNEQPLAMTAGPNGPSTGIRNHPPDPITPFLSGKPVELFTSDGQPVGTVISARNTVGVPQDWDAPPAADEDCFDSGVDVRVTVFSPFCEDDVRLDGRFRVLRDAAADASGGGGTPDFIPTLMAKARLDGASECLGPLTARLHPGQSSGGGVSRLTPEEHFPADSFFDVFVSVDSGIGNLFTLDPSRMATTVNALPPDPGEIFFGPGAVVPLFHGTCVISGASCVTDEDCPGGFCEILQVGEMEAVAGELREDVECPAGFRSRILFGGAAGTDLSGGRGGGGADPKDLIDVGIVNGGGGVV
jgi:hypothetical protein